jgi:two-component system cell cycle response regulator DivK
VGQKILVVEDNELNLKLFCDLLRAHGYEAEPVRDGREAVERARAFGPDLIVMDIQMPHVSGLDLIEQLKEDAELCRTPIMAVTAYAAKGDEERIRAAGAEGYVSKPISVMRFVEAVQTLLAAPRPERQEAQAAQEAQAQAQAQEPEPRAAAVQEARVGRWFEAPAAAVFDAWLDEATAGEWLFATDGGETIRVAIEPRPGGRFEIVERRGGEDILHTGVYEEIDRPTRLVFTLQVPRYSADRGRVTIEIAPAEPGSELILTQSVPPAGPATAEAIAQGWAKVLDALAARLDRKGVAGPPEAGE